MSINLVNFLELAGIVVFAASGALLALERGFDVVGLVALGSVTALGGGVLRDLIIADGLPYAFDSPVPLITSLSAAIATVIVRDPLERWRRTFLTFDAAGLALFAVTGALVALEAGLGGIPSTLLGVLTATGGGVTRDVLAGEPPQIFRSNSRLYAIPAAVGAGAIVACSSAGLADEVAAPLCAALVFAIRIGALRFGWRAPTPRRRQR